MKISRIIYLSAGFVLSDHSASTSKRASGAGRRSNANHTVPWRAPSSTQRPSSGSALHPHLLVDLAAHTYSIN